MPPAGGQTENIFTPLPCMSDRGSLPACGSKLEARRCTTATRRVTKNGRKVLDRAGLRKHQSLRRTSALAPSERNGWTKPQALAIPKEGYFQLEQGRHAGIHLHVFEPIPSLHTRSGQGQRNAGRCRSREITP